MIHLSDIKARFPKPEGRFPVLKEYWEPLLNQAFQQDRTAPQNSNSYSAALITQYLMDGAVTVLQNRWAPLMAFTRDFNTDPYKPLASGQLKIVTTGPTVQTGSASAPITN